MSNFNYTCQVKISRSKRYSYLHPVFCIHGFQQFQFVEVPATGAFSSPALPGAFIFSALAAALGGCGGAAALCIPCESHRINGARAPV